MGQIVKRKKKGRPSKADLVAEKKAAKAAAQPTEKELRRSGRRRNARYTLGFDDYLDDDEYYFDDDNEEDERRREKKLKLLLKLHGADTTTNDSPSSPHPHPHPPPSRRVVDHAPSASSSSASDDDTNPSKKRKLDGDDEEEEDDENDDVDDDDNNFNHNDDDDEEVKRRKREATKEVDSAPGTPLEPSSGLPLPDKKSLELILDKLQKKDRYSVYAQPVDPEELPDYHDVIEHPMDFSTIRKKLANGSYATLEQFKSDVFLLCSNAMQYNAPDTIYYKQARSIQELAKKKFEQLRMDNEHSEKELKSEQKPKYISIVKQIRKPISRTVQEPVGSDFSSGATRATAGDFQNCPNAVQAGVTERPSSLDGLIEGNASIIDTSLDKAEESLPGKGPISRFGRKISVHDENRRATYNTSTQPVASSESIFSTFDGESKLLIPVGLYVDNSYARSLARFAGTLGPVAWRVASKRIEQVLPQGSKFGRGWVGEYEPLPTPVLMLENCTIREPPFFMKHHHTRDTRTDDKLSTAPVASKDVTGPTLGGKFPIFNPAGIKATTASSTNTLPPGKEPLFRGTDIEGKPSSFCSPGSTSAGSDSPSLPHLNSQTRNFIESKKVLKQVELSSPPSMDRSSAQLAAERQVSSGTEVLTPRSVEMVSVNRNLLPTEVLTPRSVEMVSMNRTLLPCGSFKHPSTSGVAAGGLPNGRVISNSLDSNREVSSSSDTVKMATYFPHGQEQGLSDPVQLMRMLTEKNQNQLKSANQSPGNTPPVQSSAQSLSREDSGNATAAAARAWMSMGAGGFKPSGENLSALKNQISADSLYNPTHDLQPQVTRFRGNFPSPAMHFQPGKNSFPLHAFVPQPSRVGNAAQFQNRPMGFPQLVTADLSRFQVQSPWRSVNPQTQQVQKQETLPPDLNISFQSSGSPGRPSSGVLVDSQQPDLALQL